MNKATIALRALRAVASPGGPTRQAAQLVLDEIAALRAQLADANKRLAEVEGVLERLDDWTYERGRAISTGIPNTYDEGVHACKMQAHNILVGTATGREWVDARLTISATAPEEEKIT